MPKGVFNWTFSDVTAVLKENGFFLNHIKGSHYFYAGYKNGKARQVCVAKHGRVAFKPRTLKGMIEQSGLDKEKWGL